MTIHDTSNAVPPSDTFWGESPPFTCGSRGQSSSSGSPNVYAHPQTSISLDYQMEPRNPTVGPYFPNGSFLPNPNTNPYANPVPEMQNHMSNWLKHSYLNNSVPQMPMGEVCKVCGDYASGTHFGVLTCEGCKGFYKRNHKEGENKSGSLHCSRNKKCEIGVNSRNSCRYCRYQKCIQVGMSRDAIKLGRRSKKDRVCLRKDFDKANRVKGSNSFLFPSHASRIILPDGSHFGSKAEDHQGFQNSDVFLTPDQPSYDHLNSGILGNLQTSYAPIFCDNQFYVPNLNQINPNFDCLLKPGDESRVVEPESMMMKHPHDSLISTSMLFGSQKETQDLRMIDSQCLMPHPNDLNCGLNPSAQLQPNYASPLDVNTQHMNDPLNQSSRMNSKNEFLNGVFYDLCQSHMAPGSDFSYKPEPREMSGIPASFNIQNPSSVSLNEMKFGSCFDPVANNAVFGENVSFDHGILPSTSS